MQKYALKTFKFQIMQTPQNKFVLNQIYSIFTSRTNMQTYLNSRALVRTFSRKSLNNTLLL